MVLSARISTCNQQGFHEIHPAQNGAASQSTAACIQRIDVCLGRQKQFQHLHAPRSNTVRDWGRTFLSFTNIRFGTKLEQHTHPRGVTLESCAVESRHAGLVLSIDVCSQSEHRFNDFTSLLSPNRCHQRSLSPTVFCVYLATVCDQGPNDIQVSRTRREVKGCFRIIGQAFGIHIMPGCDQSIDRSNIPALGGGPKVSRWEQFCEDVEHFIGMRFRQSESSPQPPTRRQR